jgi:cathepsin B
MQTFAVIATASAAAAASEFTDIVNTVNSANAGWVAAEPTHRFGSLSDVKQLCGTWTKGHPMYTPSNFTVLDADPSFIAAPEDIPAAFDVRTNWANCTVASKIRDQSACGSCWAFGSTESFEDRRCIATGEDKQFSPLDTGACSGAGNGCSGGDPNGALDWMVKTGVVSGGDFSKAPDGKSCQPYGFAPCAHHVPATAAYPVCPTAEYRMTCHKKCTDTAFTGGMDAAKGTKAFSLEKVAGMQTALMQKGTLSVAFTVYADFPTYKSGVYKHTTGAALGGHAVAFIGWGTDPTGGDYWIVKNSWNEQWGDGGTFKIARGTDECGIEDEVAGINF